VAAVEHTLVPAVVVHTLVPAAAVEHTLVLALHNLAVPGAGSLSWFRKICKRKRYYPPAFRILYKMP
jgi:Flp pilus assembly pilin Flp